MKIGCVLLAAGSGSRFGGEKLRYEVDGVSLAERACRLHAGIRYEARVLVARPNDAHLAALAKEYSFLLAVNPRASSGIGTSASAGIAALLALACDVDGALFGVCDQPYLTRETVSALISRFRADPDAIVAPACAGRRGNPVIFPKALLHEFASLDSDVGGNAIIRAHSALLTTVPVADPSELFDVDVRPDETR